MKDVEDVDIVEMVFKTIDKTEMYWNYFALYTASIFVWLMSGSAVNIGIGLKVTLLCLYAGFAFTNALAHIRSYRFLEIFLNEVRPKINTIFVNGRSREFVSNLSYKNKPIVVIVIYSFTIILNGILLMCPCLL
jgi:hypothetical protein